MSFNPNDKNPLMISRNNYEEFFLLYVDNELSEEERKAVEAFVQLHPDLRAELEVLLSTRLPADEVALGDKEMLFANSMKLNAIDESLLLYIDNELSKEAKKAVEEKLTTEPSYRIQHQLLLQTKLDANDPIVYPYKKALYRRTEKRGVPVLWMRIAAAVVIALGAGTLVWTSYNGDKPDAPIVQLPKADQPQEQKTDKTVLPPSSKAETITASASKESKADDNQTQSKGEYQMAGNALKVVKQSVEKNQIKKEPIAIPETKDQPEVAFEAPSHKAEPDVAANKGQALKQNINEQAVTSAATTSYHNQPTATTTAVLTDVANIDNEKKASLKGLLRKATRFIERRTSIKATNENDELLIGAVAIQL